MIQIRAHADPVPAVLSRRGDELVAIPENPLRGVAPGQSCVIYLGTRVVGQFTIDRTVSALPVPAGAESIAGASSL